ncbi:MAG: tRNA (adenosine(37)-N6)-threonylcarbamoyltransferase complex ATPase subunit type 1 TsaE [Myxococcaceae bacterium]
MSFSSSSPAETRALGEALGRVLQEGDFIGLVGELGAGKTELARGIARGVGIRDEDVTSPTFAIVHQHHGRIPLTHADLYRLTGSADLDGTGFHELRDGPGATLVEWVDRVPGAAPPTPCGSSSGSPQRTGASWWSPRPAHAQGICSSGGRTSCSAAPAEDAARDAELRRTQLPRSGKAGPP